VSAQLKHQLAESVVKVKNEVKKQAGCKTVRMNLSRNMETIKLGISFIQKKQM
jgi:hypothetical protein